MKLLILGGTIFLGRALAQQAGQEGHEVTLFNRGHSNPTLVEGVEHIQGDRKTDLDLLSSRSWDAVIDTCGYLPSDLTLSVQALRDCTPHYTFISTIAVYADATQPAHELSPLAVVLPDSDPTIVTAETYGALKALCEEELRQNWPSKALIIRPGLIVGPHDPSDRFTYWVKRLAQGGEVLAPGTPDQPVQLIDVRDLAHWILCLVEQQQTGIFNATGPASVLTMGEVLDACHHLSQREASLTWVTEAFLLAQAVKPWSDLPLWLPIHEGALGFYRTNCQKALAQGLTFRTLSETVTDTLAWAQNHTLQKAGISLTREAALLQAWREIRSGNDSPAVS